MYCNSLGGIGIIDIEFKTVSNLPADGTAAHQIQNERLFGYHKRIIDQTAERGLSDLGNTNEKINEIDWTDF